MRTTAQIGINRRISIVSVIIDLLIKCYLILHTVLKVCIICRYCLLSAIHQVSRRFTSRWGTWWRRPTPDWLTSRSSHPGPSHFAALSEIMGNERIAGSENGSTADCQAAHVWAAAASDLMNVSAPACFESCRWEEMEMKQEKREKKANVRARQWEKSNLLANIGWASRRRRRRMRWEEWQCAEEASRPCHTPAWLLLLLLGLNTTAAVLPFNKRTTYPGPDNTIHPLWSHPLCTLCQF